MRQKRDMDLIRLLLSFHESGEGNPQMQKYPKETILYHYTLLRDAALIEAVFVEGNDIIPLAVNYVRLTWQGHEFLDAARDDTIWDAAKEKFLKSGVSWTVSILLEWLKQEARVRLLGQQAGS